MQKKQGVRSALAFLSTLAVIMLAFTIFATPTIDAQCTTYYHTVYCENCNADICASGEWSFEVFGLPIGINCEPIGVDCGQDANCGYVDSDVDYIDCSANIYQTSYFLCCYGVQ